MYPAREVKARLRQWVLHIGPAVALATVVIGPGSLSLNPAFR
jgi:hypothetical protein